MRIPISDEERILEIAAQYPSVRQTIIFAPSLSWSADMFQRPQQLARALARQGALVFYMQPDRTFPSRFIEVEQKLFLCRVPAQSFHVIPEAYTYVVTWSIPQLATFESPRIIYDVIDHLAVFEGDSQRLRHNHELFIEKADLVTVTSKSLYQEIKPRRQDPLLCPNGVDFDHFSNPEPGPPPKDLESILARKNPIIGYHGALARWFDYQLIEALASHKPEFEFVLIGVDYDQTLGEKGLHHLQNVHWLGKKPYSKLPRYVKAFDVGLIPFLTNEITQATSPIKLYEYFAAGVPVVSSPLQEVQCYEQVLIASSIDEWVVKIDRALLSITEPGQIAGLQKVGRENRWEDRADLILDRLQKMGGGDAKFQRESNSKITLASRHSVIWLPRRVYHVWRLSGLRGVLKGIYYKLRDWYQSHFPPSLLMIPRAWRETYIPEDFSQVTLYQDQEGHFPEYQPVVTLPSFGREEKISFSLIATAYEEEDSVDGWMESVLDQSVLPAEIVILDAGSNDATVERLESYHKICPVPLKIIKESKVNIARGRNIAIEQASYSRIAVTDFGCRPHRDWLEKLTAPFYHNPETEVVAGWSRSVNHRGSRKDYPGWLTLDHVHPQHFIPSSRSIAFTKKAWDKAGGYPEWLTLTGEDTYFALELKRFCAQWAFVPSAVVDWVGSDSWMGFLKKAYIWSSGNGELGYNNWLYFQAAKRLLLFFMITISSGILLAVGIAKDVTEFPWTCDFLVITGTLLLLGLFIHFVLQGIPPWRVPGEMGLLSAQVLGFLKGVNRKEEVAKRRLRGTKGLFIILAGVPVDDTGGGARCAQLSLELLRQNYWVVYIHRFPKFESEDSGVRIAHPNLFEYRLDEFNWTNFIDKYGSLLEEKLFTTLVEMPVPDFLPLLDKIKEHGTIIYDLIDDWDTALGGTWYSDVIEEEIIHLSQGLVGSAPSLVSKLEQVNRSPVLFLPNAVNSRLFNPEFSYPRPSDLPQTDWIIIYIGALWGNWFDWELLTEVSLTHRDAAVVVIGDYRGQCPDPPPNLHFLGLKPQTSLPAYLSHAEVAIIPWKITPITQATNPLKLYEYLAMHTPVVAPNLEPLRDIPGVWLDNDKREFVRLVGVLRKAEFPVMEVKTFIQANNWQTRVNDLLVYLEKVRS